MPKPTVSVGIPYTDQGPLLGQAVASVLNQTYQDWELILYGDGPDDETASIATSFTDERIRHIIVPERRGLAVALNALAAASTGDLLARMDGDDIMHPRRLEDQLAAFDADPSLDVVGTHAYLIDENSALIGLFREPALPTDESGFLASNAFTHPTVMGKKSWFLANKYDESLLRGQDKELWLRAGPRSNFLKLDAPRLYYRVSRTHSWRRQARNSSFDRKIMNSYAHLAAGRHDMLARKAKSYIKQAAVFVLSITGRSNLIYQNKYSKLSNHERSQADAILAEILRNPIPLIASKVLAVTVTYGRRIQLVSKTVTAALNAGADEVIIVDNGMAAAESDSLALQYANNKVVSIRRLQNNAGSAAGFSAGLQAALDSEYDFYLLLDDDNLIVRGTVSELVEKYVSAKRTHSVVGVSAIRKINERHRNILEGHPASAVYPPKGAFLYFDLTRNIRRIYRRTPSSTDYISGLIPTAPYGGILVDRTTVQTIGLPNKDLGLYEDDTEWSSRISDRGAIYLCPQVEIADLEGKFSEDNKGSGPKRLLCAKDENRVYFAVRNRVFWEQSIARSYSERFRFKVNRHIYLIALRLITKFAGTNDGYKVIRSAIGAGETGDLSRPFSLRDNVE